MITVVRRRTSPVPLVRAKLGDFVTHKDGRTACVHTIVLMRGRRVICANEWDGRGDPPRGIIGPRVIDDEINFKVISLPPRKTPVVVRRRR